MVDAVPYLEGERFHQYRILRAVKNRYGSTDEVGVFEMAEGGMREVRNPSEAFLEERTGNAAGPAVPAVLGVGRVDGSAQHGTRRSVGSAVGRVGPHPPCPAHPPGIIRL